MTDALVHEAYYLIRRSANGDVFLGQWRARCGPGCFYEIGTDLDCDPRFDDVEVLCRVRLVDYDTGDEVAEDAS